MDAQILGQFLAGIAVILGAILTALVGMWKWDVHRADLRAKEDARAAAEHAAADARAADERAKEREHELKMAGLKAEKQAEEKERQLQSRLEQQDQVIISVQQTVQDKLFKVIDEDHAVKRTLTDALETHTKAVNDANKAQMDALRALSGDVATLGEAIKGQLAGEYKALLDQMGGVLTQSVTLSSSVGDLVKQVAEHHTSVMHALEIVSTPESDPCADKPASGNGVSSILAVEVKS
jgi:hypothetical protein